jgi:carbon storage regulator
MLVLSRKLGETVVIGEQIRVTVVAVQGNQVRLGFSAPDDVRIFREELVRDSSSASETCLASK